MTRPAATSTGYQDVLASFRLKRSLRRSGDRVPGTYAAALPELRALLARDLTAEAGRDLLLEEKVLLSRAWARVPADDADRRLAVLREVLAEPGWAGGIEELLVRSQQLARR